MDDSLEKLGIITDYKLYIRTVWLILGWFMIALLISCMEIQLLKSYNIQFAQAVFIPLMCIYCSNINILGDITLISMLGLVQIQKDICFYLFMIFH